MSDLITVKRSELVKLLGEDKVKELSVDTSGRKQWTYGPTSTASDFLQYSQVVSAPVVSPAAVGGAITAMMADGMVGGNMALGKGNVLYSPAKVYSSLFDHCGASVLRKLYEARRNHAAAKNVIISNRNVIENALSDLENLQKQLVTTIVTIDAEIKAGDKEINASEVLNMTDSAAQAKLTQLREDQRKQTEELLKKEAEVYKNICALPFSA